VLETHPAAQDLAGVVKGAQTAFAMFETALTRMDNVVLGSIRGGNSSSYSPMP
jgi:heme oxygenase